MADGKRIGGAFLDFQVDYSQLKTFLSTMNSLSDQTNKQISGIGSVIESTIQKTKNLTKETASGANQQKNAMSNIMTQYANASKKVEEMTNSISKTKTTSSNATKSILSDSKSIAGESSKTAFKMSQSTSQAFDSMKKDSRSLNQTLVAGMKANVQEFGQSFKNLGSTFSGIASSIINTFKKIPSGIASIPKTIATQMKNLAGSITSGFARAKDSAISQIKKIPDAVRSAGNSIKTGFATAFNTVVSTATNVVNKTNRAIQTLPQTISRAGSAIKNGFSNGIKAIPQIASNVARTAGNAFSSIGTTVKNVASASGSAMKSFLSSGMQNVLSKARSVFPGVKKQIQDGVDEPAKTASLSLGKIAGAIGVMKVASKAFSMISSSMEGAINRIDTLANADRVFENMGFKAEETQKMMQALNKSITGLPTALNDAVSGVQLLASSTGDIGKSQKIFEALNNGILGFGGSADMVNNAIVQLSQSFSNGKVDAETWNSMINSGLGPALNAIAKQMGKTAGELKTGLSEGNISVKDFQDRLIELNEKGGGGLKSLQQIAQDATKGIKTSIANFKTSVTRGVAEIIKAFDKFITAVTGKGVADWIGTFASGFEAGLKKIASGFEAVTPLAKKLYDTLKPFAPVIGGVVAGLLAMGGINSSIFAISKLSVVFATFTKALWANPIGLVVGLIVTLGVAFYNTYKKSETFRKSVDNLLKPLKKVGEMAQLAGKMIQLYLFGEYTQDKGEQFAKTRKALEEMLPKQVVDAFVKQIQRVSDAKEILTNIIKAISLSFQDLKPEEYGEKMKSLHDYLGQFIPQEQLNAIWVRIANFNNAINQFKDIFSIFYDALKGNFKDFNQLYEEYGDIFDISQLFDIVYISQILNQVGDTFRSAFTQIKQAILTGVTEGDFTQLYTLIQQIAPTIIGMLLGGIPQIAIAGGRLLLSIADGMGLNIPQLITKLTTEILPNIVNTLVTGAITFVNVGIQWINNIIAGINQSLPTLLPIASGIISNLVTFIMQALPVIVQTGWTILSNLMDGIMQALPNLINIAVQLVVWLAQTIAQNLPIIVNKGIDIVLNLLQGILSKFPQWWEMAVKLIIQFGTKLAENFPSIVKKGWELLTKLVQGIGERIPALLAMVVRFMGDMLGKILEYLPDLIILGAKLIVALIKGLWEFGKGLGEFIGGFWDSLKKGFAQIDWGEIGRNVIDGIVKGFTKGFKKAKDAVTDLAGNIGGWFKEKMGIKSPSRVMAKISQWVPAGVAVGVEKGAPLVDKAMDALTATMTKTVQRADPTVKNEIKVESKPTSMPVDTNQITNDGSLNASAFNTGLQTIVPQVTNTIGTMAKAVDTTLTNQVPEMLSSGREWITTMNNGIVQTVPQLTTSVSSMVNQTNSRIDANDATMTRNGTEWGRNILSGFNSIYPQFINRVGQFTNDTVNRLRSINNTVLSIGRQYMQLLLNGINQLYGTVVSRVTALGNQMVSSLNSKRGGFYNAGTYLMNGLISGINAVKGSLNSTMNSVANAMVGGIGKGVNGVASGVNYIMGQVESKKRINNWTIPKYASGTDGHPQDGLAMVNDQPGSNYHEIIQRPNGETFIPKARNAVLWLEKGTKVVKASMTKQILKARKNAIPRYKNGVGDIDVADFIDDEDALKRFFQSKVNYSKIKSPWNGMTRTAVDMIGHASNDMVQTALSDFFSHGNFDGSLFAGGGAFNNVYTYLVDVAQKLMTKFPGLVPTSGYRPGDAYYHGKHQAIDLAYPGVSNDPRYTTIANYAFEKFKNQIAYVITNGRVRDRMGLSGTGASGNWVTWPAHDHFDHIHLNGAFGGGQLQSGGGGGVERWRGLAIKALRMEGQYSPANLNALLNQMRTESNGDPNAINLWDPNAMKGTPSKGLMQVIDPTFRAFARSPYNKNIFDPISNILASIRYTLKTYGSLVAGWRGVGYENGGMVTKDGLYRMGEGNKAEMVLPLTKPQRAMELIMQAIQYMGGGGLIKSLSNVAIPVMDNLTGFAINSAGISGGADDPTNRAILSAIMEQNEILRQILAKNTDVILNGRVVSQELLPELDKQRARNKVLERRKEGKK